MQPNSDLQKEIEFLKAEISGMKNRAALGDLLGTTTHEFNNILMTIINYAKLGIRHKDDATRDKSLDRILAAGERAAKITRGVLGMAKNRSADLAPTSLPELIEQTLLLVNREMSQHRVQIEVQGPQDLPNAMAIGNQIQQVFLNLLVNARQAMPEGGKIEIQMGNLPESGSVWISIRDYGKGIPSESLPRIFDPYYSTKSGPDSTGKGGTGLGLSACKEVIEQHRGRIRVDSTVGMGTKFTILLPAEVQESAATNKGPHSKVDSATQAKAV